MIFICWNQNFYNTKWPTKKIYLEHPFGAECFGLNSAEMKMKTLMASPLKSKCCVEISELAMTPLESEHTDLPWGEDGHFPQHRTFPRQRGEQHGNLRPFVSFQDFILSFCSPKHSSETISVTTSEWDLWDSHVQRDILCCIRLQDFFSPRYIWSNTISSQSQDQTIFPSLQHWLSKINTNNLIQGCTPSH